jgi:hypothetical protein
MSSAISNIEESADPANNDIADVDARLASLSIIEEEPSSLDSQFDALNVGKYFPSKFSGVRADFSRIF